ncbi:MAG: hypothetical protein Q9227_006240 [Pyrenula ochraceoflavens]
MAGNKKKKKPAPNPARGVATTSVPSKARVAVSEEAKVDEQGPSSHNGNQTNVPLSESHQSTIPEHHVGSKTTQEMTPSQLEEHLEQAELQSALEISGSRARKDAHRVATRLQTDRRILRPQAAYLDMTLLDASIKNEILELERAEQQLSKVGHAISQTDLPPEIDQCMHLWTAQLVLEQLGLYYNDDALRHLLTSAPVTEKVIKDLLGSINECLDFIALFSGEADLREYDRRPMDPYKEVSDSEMIKGLDDVPSVTPTSQPSRPKEPPTVQISDNEDGFLEDSDDEMDPDQLSNRYICIKSQLFQLDNDRREDISSDAIISKRKNALQSRLAGIERDVLFDRDESLKLWHTKEIELRRALATSKKSDERAQKQPLPAPTRSSSPESTARSSRDLDDDDDEEILGTLFGDANDDNPSEQVANGVAPSGPNILMRDFGKWSGNPRKVLEDTCKSRHMIQVRFSRNQEDMMLNTFQPPHIIYKRSPREVEISMSNVATPTSVQSEAYISTVALYCIFGASSKGERPYLRLPSTWREVWDELSARKQAESDAQDLQALTKIRETIRGQELTRLSNFRSGISLPVASPSESPRDPKINQQITSIPKDWKDFWQQKTSTGAYNWLLETRKTLPIWNARRQIMQELDASSSRCLIVCGETGSGKSTQVPHYLLEHEMSSGKDCRILVTEPRRISAISLARRVSEELGERKTEIGTMNSLVGYAIRLESKMSSATRITFA